MTSPGTSQMSDRPPVFADLSLDEARRSAAEQHRLLVVDVTGPQCEPCRMMDRTTWLDERIVAWVREHAVAVQVSDEAEVGRLRIWVLPTVLIYSGERELDRTRGYRDANALLKMFAGAKERAARPSR
jgi:hypothetical protein